MTLPEDFQFSQASLQDYVDCPRRFQLRYVERVAWPAPEAELDLANERYLRQGAAFHRMLHQHLTGIPVERLSRMATDPDLHRWWRNYLNDGPDGLPPRRYPEVLLSAPLAGYRLVAKYDLVALAPGERAVIVDWKTSRKRPSRERLADRLQTRVYPYLLARAGRHLAGEALAPEQVEMVYWFADFPDLPERFAYDDDRYEADEANLRDLIESIARMTDEVWPLTARQQRCNYCRYRSLCRRGIEAGSLEEIEAEWDANLDLDDGIDLDFEQIAEIEY
ncbi:MAG TPA: PD-(D/E)XK nuclease family protein [Chloroflexi bacterium]|nr:PD-(D/E)XK nuclease family protein [Chloroflexota bacterium]